MIEKERICRLESFKDICTSWGIEEKGLKIWDMVKEKKYGSYDKIKYLHKYESKVKKQIVEIKKEKPCLKGFYMNI